MKSFAAKPRQPVLLLVNRSGELDPKSVHSRELDEVGL